MTALMATPVQTSLSPFAARMLGTERAHAAIELRALLAASPLPQPLWPRFVDARPGLLSGIWVDGDAEPPLGQLFAALCTSHGSLLTDGLAALKLATAAPMVGFASSSPRLLSELGRLCHKTSIVVAQTAPSFPSDPARELVKDAGQVWVVDPLTVAQVGALVTHRPPLALCSVVGAVRQPQVLDLAVEGVASPAWTPRELVRRCLGSPSAAWVALCGGALTGQVWGADEPLPSDVSHLLILPADHELLARRRLLRDPAPRIANACLSCDLCSTVCPESLSPHRAMQALLRGEPVSPTVASQCSGCGACSVMCPAGLLPASLLTDARLPRPLVLPQRHDPAALSVSVRLPMDLVLRRLGLSDFVVPALP
jgi:ferredoxin